MQMVEPQISIITPCFNGRPYLEQITKSVISQSYQNWEWLIVDDCSGDGSYEYLLSIAKDDNRIKPLRHEQNKGAAEARNSAILLARGEYVAFLDVDDLWHPEKLKLQIKFMESGNYNFSYTSFTRFQSQPNGIEREIEVPKKVNYNQLIINTVIATSTVMVNIKRLGAFRMKPVYYDDFVLWLDLLKREKYAYGLNKPLTFYRIADKSLSRNKVRSARKVFSIFVNDLGLGYWKSRILFFLWAANATIRYTFKY